MTLTHYMAVKQPSFAQSKWNMGEIYGLKFYLLYVHHKKVPGARLMNHGSIWLVVNLD